MDAARNVLRIDGNLRGIATVFPHREHQNRLGQKDSCARCHHLSLPEDHSTPCSRCHREMERPTPLFRHEAHFGAVAASEKLTGWIRSNHSCSVCHEPNAMRSPAATKPCLECHRKNMSPTRELDGPFAMTRARGYREAMHGTCRACHKQEQDRVGRPELSDCATCHRQADAGSLLMAAGAWPIREGARHEEPYTE
jgi:hypothetical protein